MNIFEFLPLIIILALQFLYQFQKAARRRKLKNQTRDQAKQDGAESNLLNESHSFSGPNSNRPPESSFPESSFVWEDHNKQDKATASNKAQEKDQAEEVNNSFAKNFRDRYTTSIYRNLFEDDDEMVYPNFRPNQQSQADEIKNQIIREREEAQDEHASSSLSDEGTSSSDDSYFSESERELNQLKTQLNHKKKKHRKNIIKLLKGNPKEAMLLNEIINKPKF